MHREAAIQQGLRGLGEAKKRENINYMDKAIREFSKAIHLNPNSPILYIARGRMLYKQEYVLD
jgi:predicted Zn-dependent protease